MEHYKWIDHVLCLHEQAKGLLLALQAIKTLFNRRSDTQVNDLIVDNILFKAHVKLYKTPSLEILKDELLYSSRKSIVKSFTIGNLNLRVVSTLLLTERNYLIIQI